MFGIALIPPHQSTILIPLACQSGSYDNHPAKHTIQYKSGLLDQLSQSFVVILQFPYLVNGLTFLQF